MALENIDQVGVNARQLLDQFRYQGLSTFHIQHTFLDNVAGFFVPNTEGAEIHGCIDPLPSETVIHKHYSNSFRETDLLYQLRRNEITDLVICGATSHMCIEATTRAAADYGFKCTVVEDACAACEVEFQGKKVSAADVHTASMATLAFAYANVVAISEII